MSHVRPQNAGALNPNPFEMQMIRMQMPEDMGAFTLTGFVMEPDADRCVKVPLHLKEQAEAHGLKTVVEAPAPKRATVKKAEEKRPEPEVAADQEKPQAAAEKEDAKPAGRRSRARVQTEA